MKLSNGKPISKEVADAEISKYKKISEPVFKVVSDVLTIFGKDPEQQEFFSNKHNAFVFDMDQVKRFLEDRHDNNSGVCKYLLVIFGAHYQNDDPFKAGSPTVILTGVNDLVTGQTETENGGLRFQTLDIPTPATEYPTGRAVVELPLSGPFVVKFL